jgi:small subunit ribosomal protein S7
MRGKPVSKRKIAPDSKYNSTIIAKFINYVMRKGKKSVAQKIVYGAFDILKEKTSLTGSGTKDPLDVFNQAIKNVTPQVEVKSRRIGGAHYQIPHQVKTDRGLSLAFRWIIEAAKARKGKPMKERLALELLDASQNQGAAIKKKEDIFRMARANRAFAHFAR